jgi:hypothetical protein
MGGAIMNVSKTLGPADIGRSLVMEAEENIRVLPFGNAGFRQNENSDGDASPDSLNALLGRVSETSTREIDNLIGELQTLRKKLQADSSRIQRDITDYTALSQQVMQLTKIISESVKELPNA